MNKATFRNFASALLGEPKEYNTNNGWGFGGGIGIRWEKGNIRLKLGTAYYRHLPSAQYMVLVINGKEQMDVTPCGDAYERAIKLIREAT